MTCKIDEYSKCPWCGYKSNVSMIGIFGLCSLKNKLFVCKANAFKFDWASNTIINDEFECFSCSKPYVLKVSGSGCCREYYERVIKNN